MRKISVSLYLLLLTLISFVNAAWCEPAPAPKKKGVFDTDFKGAPTYIRSKSLILKSDSRYFEYNGEVEVKQGNMTLTCDQLQGNYDEKNRIKDLTALKNVVIIQEDIRATSEKAFYEAKTSTVTMSENPELLQDKSVLTADLIRIFLEENRSTAEGTVRVRLADSKDPAKADGKDKNRPFFKKKES